MKPIVKNVIQEFKHELKTITYKIVKNELFNQIRVQIFEGDNYINEIECKNLNDAKKKVLKYSSLNICPFY